MHIVDDVIREMDNGRCTCLVLLDFSKAFDTLDHSLLLSKLHYYGFSNTSLQLMTTYLKERSQCVLINQNIDKSQFKTLKAGVPQGSILGPLLFSLYVSDISSVIKNSSLHQYADDSQIYCSFKPMDHNSLQFKVNQDLTNIYKYACDHNLKLNASKSQVLLIGTVSMKKKFESMNFAFKINNEMIPVVNESKNLGVTLDSLLNFETHVKNKIKLSYFRLKKLYHLKHNIPQKCKQIFCNSLILSLLDYGDVVYGNTLSFLMKHAIQKVQNSCMRYIYNIPFRNHISPYLNEHKILNMENRRLYHMYCLIWKIVKTNEPNYLRSKLTTHNHVHDTRNITNFVIVPHKTAIFKKSYTYIAAHLWNKLSNEIKVAKCKKFSTYIENQLLLAQRQ